MTKRVSLALLAMLCLTWVPARGDDAAKALSSLQGTWELTSVVDEGTTAPADAIRGAKAVFAKDKMTLISPDGSERTEYTIRLDPTKTPKAIDLIRSEGSFKDQAVKGIYELNGDILRICQPEQPTKPRPSKLAAPAGSGLNLMVLKKVKS